MQSTQKTHESVEEHSVQEADETPTETEESDEELQEEHNDKAVEEQSAQKINEKSKEIMMQCSRIRASAKRAEPVVHAAGRASSER